MRVAGLLLLIATAGCHPPGKPKPGDAEVAPDAVKDFDKLFAANCAGCHGVDGKLGVAPPLNDPIFLRIVPDSDLLRVVTEGRAGTPMPAFDVAKGGTLTAEQVKILAEGLKKKWPVPPPSGPVPPPYDPPHRPGDPAFGAKLFAAACAGCHGADGKGGTFEGNPVGAVNSTAFLRLCSDQMLRRTMIAGRPDLGCPNFADKKGRSPEFHNITDTDLGDLVAHLAAWRQAAKP